MAATDQRITALRAALELAPDDPAVRTLLAETLESAERWDEAVVERRALVARDPADAPAKLALARAYAAAGNRGPAEVILDELEQAGRMPSDGWRLRGELQGHPGDDLDADRREPAAGLEAEDADPTASHAGGPAVVVGDAGAPAGAFRARPIDDGGDRPSRRQQSDPADEPASDLIERPRITFADVGGMEALKEAIRLKIIYPAERPEIYAAYGQRAGGGLLLYGPPGCGKTHLARATAGEMGAAFLAIGIADVLEMWIGQSERNLRDIFVTARQHTPCVLFFDEIDALAANRTDFRSGSGRSVINQFLS
ncbi:MAG TPA: AAA family ATPase, partial [Patescibacteria group bacterium]|nr:AAA family ATPase [Patescibacteria group bacterium]